MSAKEHLVRRIIKSPQFARSETMKRLLSYLCERAAEADPQPASEYELAVSALNRPTDFDPRIDPIVRVSMANVRERLQAFFAAEGKSERLRLTIPKGQYRALFYEATAVLEVGTTADEKRVEAADVLPRFWGKYLVPGSRNILLYTELLFLRDKRGSFVRNLYINNPATAIEEARQRLPEFDSEELTLSYNFMSAGEVHFMFAAMEMFHTFGAPAQCRNWRLCSWNDLQNANLIVLGSSRTNSFLASLQGENDFVITDNCIENRNPLPHEQSEYRAERYWDGKLERVTEYALVTRRPGLSQQTCITTIAANHSRPFEGAANRLLTESGLKSLLAAIDIGSLESFPAHIQVLLRVDLVNFDEQLINVEYVTHHIID
jgi:hypothetical protein